jgi:hypothetical protein
MQAMATNTHSPLVAEVEGCMVGAGRVRGSNRRDGRSNSTSLCEQIRTRTRAVPEVACVEGPGWR